MHVIHWNNQNVSPRMDDLFSEVCLLNVLSSPLEQRRSCISFEHHLACTIGLEKQPCLPFRHPAEYIFWRGTWRISHPAPVADGILIQTPCWSCISSRPAVLLGTAGERRVAAPGMSVQRPNAGASLRKGQRCWDVKPCASTMRSPKELKVPATIWKEAAPAPVSFSEDSDCT